MVGPNTLRRSLIQTLSSNHLSARTCDPIRATLTSYGPISLEATIAGERGESGRVHKTLIGHIGGPRERLRVQK